MVENTVYSSLLRNKFLSMDSWEECGDTGVSWGVVSKVNGIGGAWGGTLEALCAAALSCARSLGRYCVGCRWVETETLRREEIKRAYWRILRQAWFGCIYYFC